MSCTDSTSQFDDKWNEIVMRVEEAKLRRKVSDVPLDKVTIIAVTKTKPKEVILDAYACGCKHFGENYVNELVDKASDPEVQEMCPDIKWHFIGHLQSNKVNKVIGIPNLYMIQTIDSVKLACLVDKSWSKLTSTRRLKIMIQVNTSGEESKSGIPPDDVPSLFNEIKEKCPNLDIVGLMTIGLAHHDIEKGPNPEFVTLMKLRNSLCEDLNLKDLEISMGMSDDFEHAIEQGSTYVRIGSALFGPREKKQNA